jgi:lipooligosaccharide transport system permease protein
MTARTITTPRAVRVWESQFAVYRRIWLSNVLGAFVQPLVFLLGMGLGVGALIDDGPGSASVLDGVSYLAFFAPALLATTAMFISVQSSLWETLDQFMWGNQYRAMVSTPLTAGDVAGGAALWHATRVGIAATGVAVVLLFFDETRTPALVPAIGAAILTGLAYALPLSAYSATRQDDHTFVLVIRLGLVPMFLFSGAFYPITELPGWLQSIVRLTPSWNGIELCRGWVLGTIDATESVFHLAYLALFVVGGWIACRITFGRRLLP